MSSYIPPIKLAKPVSSYLDAKDRRQESDLRMSQESRQQDLYEYEKKFRPLKLEKYKRESNLADLQVQAQKKKIFNEKVEDISKAATWASMQPNKEEAYEQMIDYYLNDPEISEEFKTKIETLKGNPDNLMMLAQIHDPMMQKKLMAQMDSDLKLNEAREMNPILADRERDKKQIATEFSDKKQGEPINVLTKDGKRFAAIQKDGRIFDPEGADITGNVESILGKGQLKEEVAPGTLSGMTGTQKGKSEGELREMIGTTNRTFRLISDALEIGKDNPNALGTAGGFANFVNELNQGVRGLVELSGFDGRGDGQNDVLVRNNQEVESIFRETAVQNAELKSLITDLAYAASKSADPGGRVTDADFRNQVRSLAASSSDPIAFKRVLERKMKGIFEDSKFKIKASGVDNNGKLSSLLSDSYNRFFSFGDQSVNNDDSLESLMEELNKR